MTVFQINSVFMSSGDSARYNPGLCVVIDGTGYDTGLTSLFCIFVLYLRVFWGFSKV